MSSSIRLDEKTTISKVCGWTLLVRLDPIEKKQGLIELPGDTVMRRELAQTRATVLDIADAAWSDEGRLAKTRWYWPFKQYERAPRCAVGDRILFRQYAGEMLDVEGPEKYRIINDKDVYGLLDPLFPAQE